MPKNSNYFKVITGLTIFIVTCLAVLFSNINNHQTNLSNEDLEKEAAKNQLFMFARENTQNPSNLKYIDNGFSDPTNGDIFYCSMDYCPPIEGYNGPISMLVAIDKNGILKNIEILSHTETPSYMRKISSWQNNICGEDIKHMNFKSFDTVTGATYSSRAMRDSLYISANNALQRLRPNTDKAGFLNSTNYPNKFVIDWQALFITIAFIIAYLLRYFPSQRIRRLFLFIMILFGALTLGLQYSTYNIFNLIKFNLPEFEFDIELVFFLLPFALLFTGNIYCGYLCPLGAVQELAPRPVKLQYNQKLIMILRYTKYLLLLILVWTFVIYRNDTLQDYDPLQIIYLSTENLLLGISTLIILSLFLPKRFFCRILCPTGAFLALTAKAGFFKRFFYRRSNAKNEFTDSTLPSGNLDSITEYRTTPKNKK